MTIKVGVEATFDTSEIDHGIKNFEKTVQRANEKPYRPVTKETLRDLDAVNQKFQQLLKLNGELSRRLKITGQSGKLFEEIDFSSIYTDRKTRERKLRELRGYLGLSEPSQSFGDRFKTIAAGAAQSGLKAASPATGGITGVASSALGTGMSAGFGAGLMGLLGGIVALGVSKAVGAVTEHIGKAEQNNIDLDRLKRTLGDVGVSFEQLKTSVHGSANLLGVTFDEAGKLAMQFAKLGNLSGEKAIGEIPGELATSVGMARSFGLDPSQTTGVFGQMRGIGVTRNEQETRRFALLIGETIGKSGAFAKADEVMEAIGNYAAMQTRNSMGGANVEGYAGLFAGMVGSGIPGLDPTGAGGLLNRINAALAAGGAKGEASQFFSAMVGQDLGLNSLETQVLREGGMHATPGKMFGEGSAYARYMGKTKGFASGDTSFYEATKARLEKQKFSADPDEDKLLRAMAFGNHTGLNMNQAMAMLSISSKSMGSLARFGNPGEFNASGIAGIATAMHGSAADRQKLADELLSRTGRHALSEDDDKALRKARGNDNEALRELLARLSAKYGQEETTGSIARDSKALLDNIKTSIADKLVPDMNDVREGILYLAGNRKKTGIDVLKEIAEKGSEYRRQQIMNANDPSALASRRAGLATSLDGLPHEGRLKNRLRAGVITQEQYDEKMRERSRIQAEITALDKEIRDITQKRKDLLDKEAKRLDRERTAIDDRASAQQKIEDAKLNPPTRGSGGAKSVGGFANSTAFDDLFAKYGKEYGVDPRLLKTIAIKESRLDPNAQSPLNANGTRDYGLMQHNSRYLESRGITNWRDPEQSIRAAAELLSKNIQASGGNVRSGVRMYNGSGPRAEAYADDVMRRYGNTPMPEEAALAARRAGDQYMNFRGSFDPLSITLQYPDGKQATQPMFLNPYFSRPSPTGFSKMDPFGRTS